MKLIYLVVLYVLAIALAGAWVLAKWVPIVIQSLERTGV